MIKWGDDLSRWKKAAIYLVTAAVLIVGLWQVYLHIEENKDISPPISSDKSVSDFNASAVEVSITEYTNERREKRGLKPLKSDEGLSGVARSHSKDMAENNYLGHQNPDGSKMDDRYSNVCNTTSAENVHKAFYREDFKRFYDNRTVKLETEEEVARYIVNSWMNSSSHRKALLSKRWERIGIGVVNVGNEVYATQAFC